MSRKPAVARRCLCMLRTIVCLKVEPALGAAFSTACPKPTSLRPVFAALLCTVLFSISITCGHRSAQLIGGTEAYFWRLSLAALLLGARAYVLGIGVGGAAFPLFF